MFFSVEEKKEIFFSILVSILIIVAFIFNYNFALFICKITDIPKDLSLTIISSGFAINLSTIFTIIDIALIFTTIKYFIKKLKK